MTLNHRRRGDSFITFWHVDMWHVTLGRLFSILYLPKSGFPEILGSRVKDRPLTLMMVNDLWTLSFVLLVFDVYVAFWLYGYHFTFIALISLSLCFYDDISRTYSWHASLTSLGCLWAFCLSTLSDFLIL